MEWWLGYAAIGAAVGFFAGLLGIGGGAIMVPLLVMLFEAQGLPREQILHLAVGSGMASILLTSVASVRAHVARGALRWDLIKAMTPGILIGGLVGSAVAGAIPTRLFALLYMASANMLLERKPAASRAAPGAAGMFVAGFLISAASAFAAIGGAFMTVPFMLYCGVPLLQAIGCAAAIGFPIALAGTAGFIASGLAHGGLPAWSLGYVYLPAVAGIALTSVLLAPVGAALAHRLPTRTLKRIFAGLLFIMATKMLISLW